MIFQSLMESYVVLGFVYFGARVLGLGFGASGKEKRKESRQRPPMIVF